MRSGRIANMSWMAAVLIVGIHVANWNGQIGPLTQLAREGLIRPFLDLAVPYFFLASGFFLARHMDEDGWWRLELRKRVKTLVIPFLLFNSLSLLLEGAELASHDPASIDWRWLVSTCGLNPCAFPGHDVLWFVRAVLLYVVLSPLFKALVDRFPRTTLALLGLVSLVHAPFVFGTNAVPLAAFFKYTCSPNGLFYFVLGIAVRRLGVPDRLVAWYEGRRSAAVLWFCVAALFGVRFALGSVRSDALGFTMLRAVVQGVSIPVTMAALVRIMPVREWPWAWTSFAVFVLHTYVLAALKASGAPAASVGVGYFLLCVCGVSIVATLAAYWLREYVPKAAAVMFGGRL